MIDEPVIVEWNTTVKVPISVRRLAEILANMNDEQQAQFFIEAADLMKGYAERQCIYIGKHLRECECSTDGARELIEAIAYAIKVPA